MPTERYDFFQVYEPFERRPLDTETKARLKRVTTSTIAGILMKKGYTGLFLPGLTRLAGAEHMVGLARTLRLLPARPDGEISSADIVRNPQRVAIEGVRPGDVLVVAARNNTMSGVLGDVLVTRLTKLGCAGVVTDGGMRDGEQLGAVGTPVYCAITHGAASPEAHSYVDVNLPVACAGARINPGDVIVGDADGAVVIPRPMAEEVAAAAAEQEDMETWILARINEGGSSVEFYPPNDERRAEYEAWKATRR